MSVPSWLQGKYFPRDLLRSSRPNWRPRDQTTAGRVEQERGALQAALARLGLDIQRRAGR